MAHEFNAHLSSLCKDRNLMETFDISSRKLVNYLLTLEAHYLNVPYHNSMHAADVSQAVHVLLLSPALEVGKSQGVFGLISGAPKSGSY